MTEVTTVGLDLAKSVFQVHGARADLRWSKRQKANRSTWQEALLARRPTNVVLVAMANKTARVVWAMLRRGEEFRIEPTGAA